jgi:hypothetical protein
MRHTVQHGTKDTPRGVVGGVYSRTAAPLPIGLSGCYFLVTRGTVLCGGFYDYINIRASSITYYMSVRACRCDARTRSIRAGPDVHHLIFPVTPSIVIVDSLLHARARIPLAVVDLHADRIDIMGKSQKKRSMRRHNPMRVPDSHLPKGLAVASSTSNKTEAVLPIIKKVR